MIAALFWKTVSRFLGKHSLQVRLERHISEAQQLIGIGGAGHVDDSGEQVVLQLLRTMAQARIGQPLCLFDVGANKGQFLSLALECLHGQAAHIHSFEPSPTTFATLQGKHGSRSDVTINNIGLGRERGQMELFFDQAESGLASLTKRNLDHLGITFTHTETVRIDTLDHYCVENGIGCIDLLKIDVEGHELDVLRGAESHLAGGKVRMVTFEFGGCNIDTRTYLRDYWELFSRIGMKSFHRIMPSGRLFPIKGYNERLEQFVTTNYLVVLDQAVSVD
jgi:FkbM family methyltransferase